MPWTDVAQCKHHFHAKDPVSLPRCCWCLIWISGSRSSSAYLSLSQVLSCHKKYIIHISYLMHSKRHYNMSERAGTIWKFQVMMAKIITIHNIIPMNTSLNFVKTLLLYHRYFSCLKWHHIFQYEICQCLIKIFCIFWGKCVSAIHNKIIYRPIPDIRTYKRFMVNKMKISRSCAPSQRTVPVVFSFMHERWLTQWGL